MHHQDRVHIYTDGSKQHSNVGCGVWNKNFFLMNRLPSSCTIFTAELFSIYSALKLIENLPGKFSIFTDSLSSIHALQSSCHYLVHWITKLLHSIPTNKIVIDWIPSHIGIPRNEKADTVAHSSLSLHNMLSYAFSISELRPMIKRFYLETWEQQWSALPNSIKSFNPALGPTLFTVTNRPTHYTSLPH